MSKSGTSPERRVEIIIRAGERGTRRALPSAKRREFLVRVGYAE